MTVEKRQKIEKKIAKAFILAAIAAGSCISVDNGGGDELAIARSSNAKAVLKAMFETDEERIYLSPLKENAPRGWVFLVYGNDGYDVIADYTVNLEHLIPHALIDKLKAES